MGTRLLITLALGACVLASGCEKRSTRYCAEHPQDLANCEQMDAAVDAAPACQRNEDCTPPYCELSAQICVGCLTDQHCPPDEHCDIGNSYTCKSCILDADCVASLACLPDGSCGTAETVLYVNINGNDEDTCTFDAPCATLARAHELATATRFYIKLTSDLAETPTFTKDVVLLGAGVALTGLPSATDWVIKVMTGATVKIYGLTVLCQGTDQSGVRVEGTGLLDGMTISGCTRDGAVEMRSGFTTVTRSTLRDNPGGGIVAESAADFAITNNFIHHNGTTAATRGGIIINASEVRPETVEFNTIVDNEASTTSAAGLRCTDAIVANNNIIARNGLLGAANEDGCDVTGSLVTDQIAPLYFMSPDVEPYDYHIGALSSAKDNAPAQSTVAGDFDGDLRPQGVAKDFGADEYKAP